MNLWQHQQEAINKMKDRKFLGLLFDPGCGKTRTAIEILKTKEWRKCLIICPKNMKETWRREIKKFSDLEKTTLVLRGTGKEIIQQIKTTDKRILIINHDTISIPGMSDLLRTQPIDFLIVDESHRFKSNTAVRTKKLLSIVDRIEYKLILTGTFILNSLIDTWSQLRILSDSIIPANFYTFRAKFFYDANSGMPRYTYFPKFLPKPSTQAQLSNIINDNSIVAKKNEVLDLPPFIRREVYVELPSEVDKLYKTLEKDFIALLGDDYISTDLVVTKILRLQQICVGIAQGSKAQKFVDCEKLPALIDILESYSDEKIIIWTNFVATYPQIVDVCKGQALEFVQIIGDQGEQVRQRAIDEFNNNPNVRVCIANPAAGGVGINLQAASVMVYYGKSYNLEHDLQSEARAYRGGSEIHKRVTRIDIITQGTIEEKIHEALLNKQKLSDFIQTLKGDYGYQGTSETNTGDEAVSEKILQREECDGLGEVKRARG